jgi:hypothetical protein
MGLKKAKSAVSRYYFKNAVETLPGPAPDFDRLGVYEVHGWIHGATVEARLGDGSWESPIRITTNGAGGTVLAAEPLSNATYNAVPIRLVFTVTPEYYIGPGALLDVGQSFVLAIQPRSNVPALDNSTGKSVDGAEYVLEYLYIAKM